MINTIWSLSACQQGPLFTTHYCHLSITIHILMPKEGDLILVVRTKEICVTVLRAGSFSMTRKIWKILHMTLSSFNLVSLVYLTGLLCSLCSEPRIRDQKKYFNVFFSLKNRFKITSSLVNILQNPFYPSAHIFYSMSE